MSDVLQCCASLCFGHKRRTCRSQTVLWDHGIQRDVQAGGEGTRAFTERAYARLAMLHFVVPEMLDTKTAEIFNTAPWANTSHDHCVLSRNSSGTAASSSCILHETTTGECRRPSAIGDCSRVLARLQRHRLALCLLGEWSSCSPLCRSRCLEPIERVTTYSTWCPCETHRDTKKYPL